MKSKVSYIYILILVIIFSLFLIISYRLAWSYTQYSITPVKHHILVQYADRHIEKAMQKEQIPGLSAALIKHNEVILNKGYGYANLKQHTLADAQTRYEIASNTKAFTGLALLELAQQGKIKLEAPVSNYLPWLHLNYRGQTQAITLKMLLAQTSGISDHMSLDQKGKVSTKEDTLKGRVESLNHATLHSKPGDIFNYANMNYNILGLVIQEVTGTSYENYMHTHILKPLHMKHTFFKTDKHQDDKAQGYKLAKNKIEADNPDYFRGDTPAAYLISSTSDLIPFVKMNLQPSASNQALIKQSHTQLTNVSDKAHMNGYSAGWFIDTSAHQVLHPGTLPNYSSMIILDTKHQNAVILLANLNAPSLPDLAQTLLYQIEHEQNFTELYQAAAAHSTLLAITLWWSALMCIVLCIACTKNIYLLLRQHKRQKNTSNRLYKRSISITGLIISILLYSAWYMSSWLLKGANWSIAFNDFPFVLLWISINSVVTLILSVLYFNSCILLKFSPF